MRDPIRRTARVTQSIVRSQIADNPPSEIKVEGPDSCSLLEDEGVHHHLDYK